MRGCTVAGASLAAAGLTDGALSAQAPEMLAPGVVSTDSIEYGAAFTPAGDTLYFTRRGSFNEQPRIMVSVREEAGWSEPRPVAFTHPAGDEFPWLSADGRRIYFSSARPVNGVDQRDRNDLWYVERAGDGWSEARHIGGAFGTPDIDSHPVVVAEGLFFHSRRAGGSGGVDVYFAPGVPDAWGPPQPMPFNSPRTDGEAVPTPDRRGLVFYSDRDDGLGRGDLYFVDFSGGSWGTPVNLGPEINTSAWEWGPAFDHEGRLVFGRLDGDGVDSDLWVVPFAPPGDPGGR